MVIYPVLAFNEVHGIQLSPVLAFYELFGVHNTFYYLQKYNHACRVTFVTFKGMVGMHFYAKHICLEARDYIFVTFFRCENDRNTSSVKSFQTV